MGMKGFIGGAMSSAGASGMRYYENRAREDADIAKSDRLAELQKSAEVDREARIQGRKDAMRKATYEGAGDLEGVDPREANKRLRDSARKSGDIDQYNFADKQENDFLTAEQRKIEQLRAERSLAMQERSNNIQAAAAGRAANADARAAESHKISIEDRAVQKEAANYVSWYNVAKSENNTADMARWRESALLLGADPEGKGKDGSYHANVVDGKVVVTDQKRGTSEVSYDPYAKPSQPGSSGNAVAAQRTMSYAQLQEFSRAKSMTIEDAKKLAIANGYAVK